MKLPYDDARDLMASYAQQYPMGLACEKFLKVLTEPIAELPYAIKIYNDVCGALDPPGAVFCTAMAEHGDSVKAFRLAYPRNIEDAEKVRTRANDLLKQPKYTDKIAELKWLNGVNEKDVQAMVAEIALTTSRKVKDSDKLKAAEVFYRHLGEYQGDDTLKKLDDDELNDKIARLGYVKQKSPLDSLEVEGGDDEEGWEL